MIHYRVDLSENKFSPEFMASGTINITFAEVCTLVNLIYAGLWDRHRESADAFRRAFCNYAINPDSPLWHIHGDTSGIGGIVIVTPAPKGGEDDG